MDVTPERLNRVWAKEEDDRGYETGGDERVARVYQFKDSALARVYGRLRAIAATVSEKDQLGVEERALERYYLAYEGGGLNGSLPSVDWGRAGSSSPSGRDHTAKVDWQVDLRKDFANAQDALSKDQKQVVYIVVVMGDSLEAAGYAIGRKSQRRAIAAAETVLRGAAEMLAEMWGMG